MNTKQLLSKSLSKLEDVYEDLNFAEESKNEHVQTLILDGMNHIQLAIDKLDEADTKEGQAMIEPKLIKKDDYLGVTYEVYHTQTNNRYIYRIGNSRSIKTYDNSQAAEDAAKNQIEGLL